ncbi:hypothetical protein FA09DRAFT_327603 [Tilletiopsis washingtonensis]|uniref:N-acetyltransferase domain-containing protein n=1 Tax=Tilletiopsis washingtonensis TaxID=58919 RepID=A0A316ZGJ6_9BASI|nr:hypothetical protein FA09DRAFT_327603 [Tilletiopsis washingtonensis]PWO00891.1 hypothetical protein FA09DRAFT_327603 [Tilletiopsis washingtonensis]
MSASAPRPSAPALFVSSSPPPGFVAALLKGLDEHTLAATGQLYREETFVIGLDRAEGEEVQAGLTGKTAAGLLQISLLFVKADLRGQGIGSALLRRALQLGAERGCVYACVDTFSFQAREFYEREGFEVLCEIDTTLGEGIKKIFLGRKLQPLEAR